ncbi:toll/interleukin-1 receptor domain-containing protein [Micromonospora sp. NBC_00330]|uniref:toll/interleukin-1 receptor domain-containing protein n=1 Tax=Micromonospora sp. NBC_00330 TaxID=2903585 RepID=UPI002E2BA3EB|nr:toll/interleukin-1 receptor domain-containing protein [Micromonospora sp. NBC_00330]
MTEIRIGAFWSYAHEDDRLDSGGIRSLAKHLADEYSLITGQELGIFVDRTAMQWGEEWRRRIDDTLDAVSFFIPIVTPRYFTRTECRKELIAFHSSAQNLGASELLLPILYAPIPEFGSSNPDELIVLASRYQYVDWRDYRLTGGGSPQYRRAVHELAQRLFDLSTSLAARQLSNEIAAVEQGGVDAEAGLLEIIEKIDALLPDWLNAVEDSEVNEAHYLATWGIYGPRLRRLEQNRGQGGAKFALIQRIAQEELPLAERYRKAASVYTQRSLELDPFVMRAIHMAQGFPDAVVELASLRSALDHAEVHIRENRRFEEGDPTAGVWARQRAHVSRLVRQVADTFETAERTVDEGNSLVKRWLAEWDAVLGATPTLTSGDSKDHDLGDNASS